MKLFHGGPYKAFKGTYNYRALSGLEEPCKALTGPYKALEKPFKGFIRPLKGGPYEALFTRC